MRAVLLAILLAGSVAASEVPKPQADRVTFTRAELNEFLRQLEQVVRQREAAAFQAGRADARARCASLI